MMVAADACLGRAWRRRHGQSRSRARGRSRGRSRERELINRRSGCSAVCARAMTKVFHGLPVTSPDTAPVLLLFRVSTVPLFHFPTFHSLSVFSYFLQRRRLLECQLPNVLCAKPVVHHTLANLPWQAASDLKSSLKSA
jgi:hypothetical protein